MRVGVVTGSYPRFEGDFSGGWVKEHAEWLARDGGHEVEVIAACACSRACSCSGSGSGSGTGSGSGSVIRVPGRGLFYGGGAPEALEAGGWWRAARFSMEMARVVRERARRWDAAVCHWLVPGALATMATTRLPVLAIAHSGDVHALERMKLLGAFGRLAARRDVRLSFVSEELRARFLAGTRAELTTQVCPMGIDVARFRRRAARDGGTVLFLGRLVPVKGVAHLVEAARRWRSDARLVIAGDGPERASLERAAAGAATFTGAVHGGARDTLLAAADVVVVPSVRLPDGRTEGTPLVALEAMAARAALVVSSVGGLAELPVTRVPAADPGALAAAIDDLLADPARRAAQLAAQDRHVATRDWAAVGPRLNPVWRPRSAVRGAA